MCLHGGGGGGGGGGLKLHKEKWTMKKIEVTCLVGLSKVAIV